MKDTVTFDLSENGYVYFIAEAVPYNGRMHKYGFHSTDGHKDHLKKDLLHSRQQTQENFLY